MVYVNFLCDPILQYYRILARTQYDELFRWICVVKNLDLKGEHNKYINVSFILINFFLLQYN